MERLIAPEPLAPMERPAPWRRGMADALLALSVVLCVALAMTYLLQPDACAAITVFPPWVWLFPGLSLVGLGWRWRRGSRRQVAIVIVTSAWFLYLLVTAEEPWSLLRSLTSPEVAWRAAERRHEAVRVVSLNCAIGNPDAAREVVTCRPDIVLLQESPNREAVEALADQLYGVEGSVVHGPDASLIVRGTLVPADLPPELRSYFVQARVRLASGLEVEVISVRLVPALFRLDLWSPQCWREQSQNRKVRREQVETIVRRLKGIPATIPVILGGDLNAPQGDAAFRPFLPRLHDTFRQAGRGWGNTIINELPFLRIDQVWSSSSAHPLNVIAGRTDHSDHRMVISDLVVPPR